MNHIKYKVVFDGHCQFCQRSVRELKWLDILHKCEYIDYQIHPQLTEIHPSLNQQVAASQIHLITPDGKIYGGFYAFRRMTLLMPLLFVFIPFLYLPFAGPIGQWAYQWVARHRYLFNSKLACKDNQCNRP